MDEKELAQRDAHIRSFAIAQVRSTPQAKQSRAERTLLGTPRDCSFYRLLLPSASTVTLPAHHKADYGNSALSFGKAFKRDVIHQAWCAPASCAPCTGRYLISWCRAVSQQTAHQAASYNGTGPVPDKRCCAHDREPVF